MSYWVIPAATFVLEALVIWHAARRGRWQYLSRFGVLQLIFGIGYLIFGIAQHVDLDGIFIGGGGVIALIGYTGSRRSRAVTH